MIPNCNRFYPHFGQLHRPIWDSLLQMGRRDPRTARGKIFRGSYGKSRPKRSNTSGEVEWWHRESIHEGPAIPVPYPSIPQGLQLAPRSLRRALLEEMMAGGGSDDPPEESDRAGQASNEGSVDGYGDPPETGPAAENTGAPAQVGADRNAA
eukprot:jgi/Botrbrau1/8561/Bobra.0359s0025.1